MSERIKCFRSFTEDDKRATVVRDSGKTFTALNPFSLKGKKDSNCLIEYQSNRKEWVLLGVSCPKCGGAIK